jgi:hypothetical protein
MRWPSTTEVKVQAKTLLEKLHKFLLLMATFPNALRPKSSM